MTSAFTPFEALLSGGPEEPRAGDDLERDPGEAEVTQSVRRRVAERLTKATRDYETINGTILPTDERAALTRRLISEALDAHAATEMSAGRPPPRPRVESRVARSVANALLGAGGLERWLADERVEEVHAIGCDRVFVRFADGTRHRVAPIADSDAEMVDLVRRLAADAGRAESGGEAGEERRWERSSPILNLQLPDGSRLHAVIAVTKRPSLSIRRHGHLRVTLADLEGLGTINPVLRAFLGAAVRGRLNIVGAGRTGAGKTTLLRALASEIDMAERVVTIEDTYELALESDAVAHREVVALQARENNVEGMGAIDMADLFRTALRMSPDRVIVGEVRGHEVIPMLNAMSQGNNGSLSTIHASSSAGVFAKLALYAAQSPERLDQATTNLLVAEAIHLVTHIVFAPDGRRVISSIREVVGAEGLTVSSNEIFRPGPDGRRAVPGAPMSTDLVEVLGEHGLDLGIVERARADRHSGWTR